MSSYMIADVNNKCEAALSSGNVPARERTRATTLLRDTIYNQIKKLLLSGSLPPGTQIRERDFAKRFEVSKSPVRDALHRLQMEGFVDVLPRKGYKVRSITLEEALELYEMRMILECACVERAIRAATDAELHSLGQMFHETGEGNVQEWIAYNREFHLRIAHIAGNTMLENATREVITSFDRLTFASVLQTGNSQSHSAANLTSLDREHDEIAAAMLARDAPLAVSLMHSHIEKSRSRFLQSYSTNKAASPILLSDAKSKMTGAAELAARGVPPVPLREG